MSKKQSYIIQITKNGMGNADLTLQHKLMKSYLNLILESSDLPDVITFYTEGVKLTVEGSPVLDELNNLSERGVLLFICGTCLKYYELTDKVKAGISSHMADILAAQQKADKVVTL